ncbi:hypothetical protein BOTBODRAFT_104912 [Botryobasidium botryosum FD-172 SS1]|uniref:Peptidase S28 n=1 Tax=Botryobasidium botryosum (strain FD-172 SS1) TaxID=930990 RepID=A0A067MQW0_BOTB1|nr:hypothetical protein BOTBODRAFT_104912 [Botryobasidium botryosum FD-172 SS1]
MLKLPWLAVLLLSSATGALRWSHLGEAPPQMARKAAPPPVKNGVQLPPRNTTYTFDQLIDHHKHRPQALGTFKQRYFFSYEFYEKGGPIVLVVKGESPLDGFSTYLTKHSIHGAIARATKGATVVLEHRFFGQSNPYPNLSEECFRFLTLEQTIDDLVHFARIAVLPMPGGDSVGADTAAWFLTGISYAGALVNWAMNARPGIFWAGHASSAIIESVNDFWHYWEPIKQYMPQNCSADVQQVIGHVDQVFTSGSTDEIDTLGALFDMSNATHLDDIVHALTTPLTTWQQLSPSWPVPNNFTMFCDALEVKDGAAASESGWGLEHAIHAFGDYMKTVTCTAFFSSRACVDTHTRDASWTEAAVGDSDRLYSWLLCNYLDLWHAGAPYPSPTLVSRLITPAYYIVGCQCQVRRPELNCTPRFLCEWQAQVSTSNSHCALNSLNRISSAPALPAAGDPWRGVTISSDLFIDLPSTDDSEQIKPVIGLSDGYHSNDIWMENAIDPTIARVQHRALRHFKLWIKEHQSQTNSSSGNGNNDSSAEPSA